VTNLETTADLPKSELHENVKDLPDWMINELAKRGLLPTSEVLAQIVREANERGLRAKQELVRWDD
jgi:hypothetical protein